MKNYIPYIFLYFLFYTLSTPVFAQGKPLPGISGKVTDPQGAPIPYANVALYRTADSALVNGVATGEEGNFSLDADPGNYYLEITFLTFDKKIIRDINLTSTGVELGNIALTEGSVGLDEVVVEGVQNQMQFKLDKRVYNVGADLTSMGSDASALLDNVPSVTVDLEGNVSLRGSGNVRILIDGKPSGMAGISSADALRQIPANMIESVEVITNPSARYEAEGEVGIINIILKKNQSKGINGTITANAGYPEDYGLGLNLNFRKDKVNFFTNINGSYDNRPGSGYRYQEFFSPGNETFIYESERERMRGGIEGNFQFGVDYFLNNYNTFTASGLYSVGDEDNYSEVTYRDLNEEGDVLQTTVRTDHEQEVDHDIESALNYTRTFPKKDRKLSMDARYMLNDDTEISDYEEVSTATTGILHQRSSNTEDQEYLLFQADYIDPIGEEGKFEIGGKVTMRNIENAFKVEEQNNNGEWVTLPNFHDELAYEENIYAAYLIYGNKWKKLSYQAGLRTEYSDITTSLIESNESDPKDYIDFFPSAHMTYEFNPSNQLQLSYSRRLSRPHFRHLLPFYTFSDSRVRYQGNPDLDPEYSNSFETGYLRYFAKGSVLSSIFYRYNTGVIERITLVDSVGITQMIPINLSTENAYGLEFSGNYEMASWAQFTGNVSLYRSIVAGEYEGESLSRDAFTANGRGSLKFKLPMKTNIQTSLNYRAPSKTTQGRSLASYSWDAGISKEILKGKGTLTFNVRDILNSRKWNTIIETPEYYSRSEFQWRARQFNLAFSYRINRSARERTPAQREMDDMDF